MQLKYFLLKNISFTNTFAAPFLHIEQLLHLANTSIHIHIPL